MLAALKFVGIFLTGVFGLLPLLFDYRDKKRNLTLWGKMALCGVLVSSLVSAGAQYLELVGARADAEAAIERNNALLGQISRSLNLIKDVRLNGCIDTPTSNSLLSSYVARVDQSIKGNAIDAETVNQSIGPDFQYLFRSGSSMLPDQSKEPAAYDALGSITIDIVFFKSADDIKTLTNRLKSVAEWNKSDLKMNFFTSFGESKNQLIYRVDRFSTLVQAIDTDPHYWQSSGKIRSIDDLANSYMAIILGDFVRSGSSGSLAPIRATMGLRGVLLQMTDGRDFYLKSADFLHGMNERSEPYYVYRFSSDTAKFATQRNSEWVCVDATPSR